MTDLSMTEGEDVTFTTILTDSDGDAIDITGYTFLFTVKRNINNPDSNAIISKEITVHADPTGGTTTVTIDREDTLNKHGGMVYDYDWIDTSDKRRKILRGAFTINQAVTDREVS